jgi:hypothetical protein
MSAALLAFSNQHRVGIGLDGLPGRASARRSGGKRALTPTGRSEESVAWRQMAASRYDELIAAHPAAFADHAAEFWLGVGNDPRKGFRLAEFNLPARQTPRAYDLLAQALDANAAGAASARNFGVHLSHRAAN